EPVTLPGGERGPRLLLYLEEKNDRKDSELLPDVDDSFKPSGAVTELYGGLPSVPTDQMLTQLTPLDRKTLEPEQKFCINCGSRLRANAKFCTKCGSPQAHS
ncbi:MAG TPA: zinc ribbon domain-containing protein, partial [Nitrososphaera sp.]|nr:zinc ribbon domain-containing protein [Nitrososphaera sp.]